MSACVTGDWAGWGTTGHERLLKRLIVHIQSKLSSALHDTYYVDFAENSTATRINHIETLLLIVYTGNQNVGI